MATSSGGVPDLVFLVISSSYLIDWWVNLSVWVCFFLPLSLLWLMPVIFPSTSLFFTSQCKISLLKKISTLNPTSQLPKYILCSSKNFAGIWDVNINKFKDLCLKQPGESKGDPQKRMGGCQRSSVLSCRENRLKKQGWYLILHNMQMQVGGKVWLDVQRVTKWLFNYMRDYISTMTWNVSIITEKNKKTFMIDAEKCSVSKNK